MPYQIEVIADNSGRWIGNGLYFRTHDAAKQWGDELFMRWTLVRETRVVEVLAADVPPEITFYEDRDRSKDS